MGTNGMTSVAREEMMRGDEVRLERTIAAREERTEVGFCQTSAQVALMSATKPFGITSSKESKYLRRCTTRGRPRNRRRSTPS